MTYFGDPVSDQAPWVPRTFPQIETIQIEVDRAEGVWEKDRSVRRYDRESFRGEAIPCGNHTCFGGFADLTSIIREMVRNKETHRESREGCPGYEGSPKGKILRRRCRYRFIIRIDIKYHDAS